MNSKRMFTLLLALCLMFGAIAPAASAVHAGVDNVKPGIQQNQNTSSGSWLSDLIASAGEKLGFHTIRDDKSHLIDRDHLSFVNGRWVATIKNGVEIDLSDVQLPEDIQLLRKMSDHYSAQDVVYAFVVLADDPTAEQYSSILDVPAELTASLNSKQNSLIGAIEQNVLSGDELQVVSRFTHLTNSVVIATEFGNLEAIADLQGVKSVFLSPVFAPCETTDVVYPATTSSTVMSGVASVWQDLGYTGQGMTIAILDTGLDLDHPSFASDPAGASWTMETVQEMLDQFDLQAEDMYAGTLTAEDLYYSAKVPFTFNYAMGNTDVSHADGVGDHGTHVAGIAAANNLEGSGVVGMAPDAQVIVMKVFNSETGGSNMFDLVRAMEDCMILGIDVVNMSLGSPAGFTESLIPEIDSIFARINESDIIFDVAAGNEATSSYGSSYGPYMQTTENIDNATISSPSTYANAMSVASVDNAYVYSSALTLADGTQVFYMQAAEWHNGYIQDSLDILAGSEIEYVIIPGLGDVGDFYDESGNSIVEGKIAIVRRGSLSFAEKTVNAEEAGALGVLIWDNVSEDIFSFGMSVVMYDMDGNPYYPGIPVVLISLEDGQIMNDATTKILTVDDKPGIRKDAHGGQMSSFSCWGVAPDLRLLPDLTGIGGNIMSCYDGGQYGLMSGTSMATPQVAGVTALVLQYLREAFPDATEEQTRILCDSLLMSTAVTVIDNLTGLEASPRQQGAGLVNALNAITAEAYLTVEGSDRPKAELGDNASGEYSFTFTVHNFSDAAKTYDLRASLLCEDFVTDEFFEGLYFMAEYEHALDASAVTFSTDSVTVEAGGSVEVTVSIALTDADMEWIETYFPSGNYVEGFVYLEGEDEVTLSLPFLGFYGAWDAAPVFDAGYWYQNGFWADMYPNIAFDEVEANEYYHVLWTNMDGQDWVLGFNPYEGVFVDQNGDVIYSERNNVLSPNGDGIMDGITEFYISLMRNAEEMNLIYTDAEGNVLHDELLQKESKTMYISAYGGVVPFVYSWYYDDFYDFTDAEGNYLPDGTTIYLTISGCIDYEGAETQILNTFPISIDTSAPVLNAEEIVESTDEEGNHFVTLTFADAHPAFAALMNPSGTQIYNRYSENDMVDNGDGTWSVTMDVTGRGDNFSVVFGDYGCNESYYDLAWSESGANNPEIDEEALYAYQTFNMDVYYTYGWDYMFGWHTIDKESAMITQLNSDAYEYYALTAAEYAGGYVFAVDAGYNFLYMVPGVWNRNIIRNLGVNVVDMAFDDVTQTMYLATTDKDNYSFCLYTVDLLTGELTLVNDYYDQSGMPWAMTFVDGQLYCCKYYQPGFYRVDMESGWYDLIPVLDAEGNEFIPTNPNGSELMPYYSQSMTYSAEDGLIYWAYYSDSGCGLVKLNPADWTYTYLHYASDQQYAGLFTAEDDGFELPESEAVAQIALSAEQVILGTAMTYQLDAYLLPWNAPVTEDIVWLSSDESVAVVEDGIVASVGEGVAVISAMYADVYAECIFNVVNIGGVLNAYKYTDANYDSGYWLNIDLANVTEEGSVYSPVDFIAADYNGHTGIIYGYDQFGQCYWFDPATGEYGTLGASNSAMIPADMAYDYSTGLMYVIVYDANTMSTTLYVLNMNTGALVKQGVIYDVFLTLACSLDGTLYAIDYMGYLFQLEMIPMEGGDIGGGGIGGWEPLFDDGFGVGDEAADAYYIEPIYLMETMISPYYIQSMCYDHNNDALLWINPETGCIYWIDGLDTYSPFMIALGDPSGTGFIEYVGTHVIPDEIPELPFFPVTSATAEDMVLLAGQSKPAQVSVLPLNATSYIIYNSFSMDESVAYYDEETGMVVAVGEGTTMIGLGVVDCGEDLVDDGVTDPWYDVYFQVTVKNPTDNIYAYQMQDLGNGDGGYWTYIPDYDPSGYIPVEYVYYDGMYMLLYSAEYMDGYIYAYGYDMNDYSANFMFLTIDANSMTVIDAVDMGKGFPFVYDMAFDYTTGTMFALAGPSDNTSDLYFVNLANGQLIDAMATGSEYMFLSLAIDGNGTIYAMASSKDNGDYWNPVLENAQLYTLDPVSGSIEWFMDSGVTSNMLSTMAYDYDTGYIYWHAMNSSQKSGLYLLDIEEYTSSLLGTVGPAGSQITAMFIIADEYPEIPDELNSLVITNGIVEINPGISDELELFLRPATVDVELTWVSADESIATVDQNGVVTGIAAGVTTVTVTAVDGKGNSCSADAKIIVYGADDYFISYNITDGGFAAIGRPDSSVVTNLTEGEGEAAVTAMAMINGYIYAYDENNNLFVTSVADNFERTYIGNAGIEVKAPYTETNVGYYTYTHTYEATFVIRDMVYDTFNDRLLALGCYGMLDHVICDGPNGYHDEYDDVYELDGGCRIYEVDQRTGALIELLTVGGENAEPGVRSLAITDTGRVFVYTTFMDYVMEMNMETGEVVYLTTFQNQGVSGSTEGHIMSMTYDEVADALYITLTQNGKHYKLYQFNLTTHAITEVGYIGTVEYKNWAYLGDAFAGLVINEAHDVHSFHIAWEKDGYVKYECICGECYLESYGLIYSFVSSVDADCNNAGYVTYYNPELNVEYIEELPALGHEYVITESFDGDCTKDGFVTYTCDCGDTYTEYTYAKGHNYEKTVVEPNCEDDGYTMYTCVVCGHSYRENVVSAYGHNYVSETFAPVGGVDGKIVYTCVNCGDVYEEVIEASHNYVLTEYVAPTCGTEGMEVYTCSDEGCSYSYTMILDPLGHNYEVVVFEATCEIFGCVMYYCVNEGCYHAYTDEYVEEVGHDYVAQIISGSCTEDGQVRYVCRFCGETQKVEFFKADGHNYSKWYVVKEATETTEGRQVHICLDCDHVEYESIPVIDAALEAPEATEPPKQEDGQ